MSPSGSSPGGCVALVQVVGAEQLCARVPAALTRGEAVLEATALDIAARTQGTQRSSSARALTFHFDAACDAVRFAIQVQAALLGLDWPATLLVRPEAAEERRADGAVLHRGLRVRIAIHSGVLWVGADGAVDGPGLYQAARVLGAAHGGQTLVSGSAWQDAVLGLHEQVVMRDLGAHVLSGSDGHVQLVDVLPPSLEGRTFPLPSTENVRRSNISGIGHTLWRRQGDLGALSELLAMGLRAVSVVGSRAAGKSVLVRQFASERAEDPRFTGGAWLCRVDAPTPGALCRAIGWALQVPLDERATITQAVDQLGYALATRGPLLLVLDELASADPEVVAAIDRWLRMAPQMCCVINASDRLGVHGEVLYEVRALPSPVRDAAHGDAVRLYAALARGVDEDFTIDSPLRLAQLTAAVGGMPLSIGLLAGFVDRLPPDKQLERLGVGLLHPDDLLSPLLDLLSPEEWQVLVACAALPGSFDVRALDTGAGTVALVERLASRGLLRDPIEPGATHLHRYVMDEPLREQVVARLPPEERPIHSERRANALVRACEAMAVEADGPHRSEVVARLAVDWEGLVDCVRIGLDPDREDAETVQLAIRACLVLRPVLEARGPMFVGLELVDAVLRRADAILGSDPLLQLRLLVMRAAELRRAGRFQAALTDLDRAAAIAERWSDGEGLIMVRIEQGRSLFDTGASDLALELLENAISRREADTSGRATAVAVLGALHLISGRMATADTHLSTGLDAIRAERLTLMEARTLSWLGLLCHRVVRYEEAQVHYRDAVQIYHRMGVSTMESRTRSEWGLVQLQMGRVDEARAALQEALVLARSIGDRRAEATALRYSGIVRIITGAFEDGRETLLEALAIDRDRGDISAEGVDAGYLALAYHLGGLSEPASDSYRRATGLLSEQDEHRMLAFFSAWAAAHEAELGAASPARSSLRIAQTRAPDSFDSQLVEVLAALKAIVDLMEADLLAESGEVAGADALRAAAAATYLALEPKAVAAEARAARGRLGERLSRDTRPVLGQGNPTS